VMLASFGFYNQGEIGNLLQRLSDLGFFSYVLPFLIIFAIVFGILQAINLFKDNRAVNAIIALSVGLLSLQFDFVPVFFSEVFPRLGVGLAVILVIIILIGLFLPKAEWVYYVLFAIGAITAIVVLLNTSGYLGWGAGYWLYDNWLVLTLIAFAILVVVLLTVPKKEGNNIQPQKWLKNLFD
jgi:hypothetical protein